MITYNRRGKTADNQGAAGKQAKEQKDQGKKVNGLQQVIDMLEAADPEFRKSLLKRITSEDSELASRLKERLRANQT